MERQLALTALLDLSAPVRELSRTLANFPWDVEKPLVELLPQHVVGAIAQYLAGNVTAQEIGGLGECH